MESGHTELLQEYTISPADIEWKDCRRYQPILNQLK
mgnify:CR=1 FL=1